MIIVDGSSLIHRVLNTSQGELTTQDGRCSGGIHGFLVSLSALCRKRRCREGVVVAFDSGIPLHRRELFQNYKPHKIPVGNVEPRFLSTLTQTKASDPSFLEKYSFTRDTLHKQILPRLGCISVRVVNTEADDIIATWCKLVKSDHMTILSTDRDLYQLVTDDIDQFNGTQQLFMTKDALISEYNLDPQVFREHYVMVKAVCGDGSDGIPGPEGVGTTSAIKYASQIINLWQNLYKSEPLSLEVLQKVAPHLQRPNGSPVVPFERLKDSSELIWRNYCLTDLYYPIENNLPMFSDIKSAFARTNVNSVDEDAIMETLDSLQMKSAKDHVRHIMESNDYDDLRVYLEKFI